MIEIRPSRTEADKAASVEIFNVVCPRHAITLDESLAWERSMRDHVEFLALADAQVVGAGVAAVFPSRLDVPFTLITVLPPARRQGAGQALYRTVSEWAAERGFAQLETWSYEEDVESLAFAGKRGFRERSRSSRLVLDVVAADPPVVAAPEGVEIVPWAQRLDLAVGIHALAGEVTPEIPGSEDWTAPPLNEYVETTLRGPWSRPEGLFVALADTEVVGYATLVGSDARPGTAGHGMTAVKRAWRGRGIGGALKRAQIAWAKQAGITELETSNEVRNEPIRRLNETLGYREAPGQVSVRGPLAAEAR